MSADPIGLTQTETSPGTIVLIHGLWMTPRSWEHWVEHYSAKGYTVITPTYPGFEIEVEALRADPTPIATANIHQTIDRMALVVSGLDSAPILIGHSFGGTLVQLLLDRGLGAAGVAINSAPTEGVLSVPFSQIKSFFPVLSNPANRKRAVGFTPEQFQYAFTNTLGESESAAAYERYHIPAPGSWVWEGVLANVTPGHQANWVNYRNDNRAPLLFVAGGEDHIMPPAVNKANAGKYERSKAVTDYHEFPGRSHFTVGEVGWETVADYVLEWAVNHAIDRQPAVAGASAV